MIKRYLRQKLNRPPLKNGSVREEREKITFVLLREMFSLTLQKLSLQVAFLDFIGGVLSRFSVLRVMNKTETFFFWDLSFKVRNPGWSLAEICFERAATPEGSFVPVAAVHVGLAVSRGERLLSKENVKTNRRWSFPAVFFLGLHKLSSSKFRSKSARNLRSKALEISRAVLACKFR